MKNTDQHIIASLNLINNRPCLLQRVGHFAALQVGGIPSGNIRSHHSDHGDPDSVHRQNSTAVCNALPFFIIDIAGENLAVQVCNRLLRDLHAIVVIMVSRDPDIIV